VDLNLKSPSFLTRALLPQLEAARPPRRRPGGQRRSIDGPCRMRYSYSRARPGCTTPDPVWPPSWGLRSITVKRDRARPFESKMMAPRGRARRRDRRPIAAGPYRRPDDIAGVVVFLTSRAGSYITARSSSTGHRDQLTTGHPAAPAPLPATRQSDSRPSPARAASRPRRRGPRWIERRRRPRGGAGARSVRGDPGVADRRWPASTAGNGARPARAARPAGRCARTLRRSGRRSRRP
jgi:hypothetical protein